jgi:hypothetical protein
LKERTRGVEKDESGNVNLSISILPVTGKKSREKGFSGWRAGDWIYGILGR